MNNYKPIDLINQIYKPSVTEIVCPSGDGEEAEVRPTLGLTFYYNIGLKQIY